MLGDLPNANTRSLFSQTFAVGHGAWCDKTVQLSLVEMVSECENDGIHIFVLNQEMLASRTCVRCLA